MIYLVVQWDGAHPTVLSNVSLKECVEWRHPSVSKRECVSLIRRFASDRGAYIAPNIAVHARGSVIRVCGGCSACGLAYDPGGREITL